jgi:competence protein ComEC
LLLIFNIFIYSSLDDEELLPDHVLSVFMIDIGQGDSFLIKFPNGETALVDAGNTNFYFDNGERVIIPLLNYFNIEKIDYAFISHIDSDHYAGFVSLVLNGKIKTVYKPMKDTSLSKDTRFEKFLNDFNISIVYYSTEILTIGDVNLYILNYDKFINSTILKTNNRSGVIKLSYGKNSFLFTGDLEKSAEREYAKKYKYFLDSDVLKVSHHGSKTSTSKEFLNFVTPEISLISTGIINSFGHPASEVLIRLNSFKSEVLRTDLDKAALLRSDGNKIEIVNWK